jgi:formylglycine-generating enzyme required for sulfatase activity
MCVHDLRHCNVPAKLFRASQFAALMANIFLPKSTRMPSWFLSYHSPDQALADRLKSAIECKDAATRVFFAPTNLRAGGSWSAQLAQEIAEADAFIFLVGAAGVGSWQVPEYDEALDRWVKSARTFPLIVILLEGQKAPGLPFLRQLHWLVSADPTSDKDLGRLFDAASGHGGPLDELWRFTSPYRGLEAMEEKDSDYFFGRSRETVEILDALATPDRLPVLIGNSGVGKSSLAQAGVLAALKRQAWPEPAQGRTEWPEVFQKSRRWCYLSLKPGTEPVKALVESFVNTWQFTATDPMRSDHQHGWIDRLRDDKATLSDLIEATERRRAELDQAKPPAFLLYIDQGEELYVRAGEGERRRFSELLVETLADPRLRIMMSMRADFLGALQSDKRLFKARYQIDVPPLGEDELREVVSRPAQLLGARFEPGGLIDIITRRTVDDSIKDVGALPLLSYTLDDMWREMTRQGDGLLRLPAQSFELGGVLVSRANRFLAEHLGAEDALRRALTLRLATVREDGEPTRRRANRTEFSDEEWWLVSELADYPNRLIVTLTTETGETYAQVAHEALFRRWQKLREWIAAEREFLTWRSGLEVARQPSKGAPDRSEDDTLLMGHALARAQDWLAKRADDLSQSDREFIERSIKFRRIHRSRTAAAVLGLAIVLVAGTTGWANREYLKLRLELWADISLRQMVRSPDQEMALKPKEEFQECTRCPVMVVVPPGEFTMGSPLSDAVKAKPQHKVTVAQPFALSKYEVTFEEWDTCFALGGCSTYASDQPAQAALPGPWGRGKRPVINVSWGDAQEYVAWLSKETGKSYRLPTETEWEYAARAGSTTNYSWGDDIRKEGKVMANCAGCGSEWDNQKTAPVGSFAANAFGLFDMHGNVRELVQDCWNDNYVGAPVDGSARISGEGTGGFSDHCARHVARGGSWGDVPRMLHSATRAPILASQRGNLSGLRVARTIPP